MHRGKVEEEEDVKKDGGRYEQFFLPPYLLPRWPPPSKFWNPNVLFNARNQGRRRRRRSSSGSEGKEEKDHLGTKTMVPSPHSEVLIPPPTSSPLAPPPPSSCCSSSSSSSSSGDEEEVASHSCSSSSSCSGNDDLTALLSDELLLRILSLLQPESQTPTSLVSRRFLRLIGLLRSSLTLLRLSFLHTLPSRFPNLTSLDLLPSLFLLPLQPSPLLLSRGRYSLPFVPFDLNPDTTRFPVEPRFVRSDTADAALLAVARSYPSLRSLSLAAIASTSSLLELAGRCSTLQHLEIHRCHDASLRPISEFANLQILRLVAALPGLYSGPGVTDVGLTIVAHGCKRLVKLELCGCEGSYDGISAVGKCCPMLEELVVTDHRMDSGWIAGLSYCCNLRTLKLVGCRGLDADPGPLEHLGSCEAMERLHLQRCPLRDRTSLAALLSVCRSARDAIFQDCWGLDDDVFAAAAVFRRVNFLCIEGCSLLTTGGLESVILSWKELQSLSVVACKNMKNSDISPTLSSLFAMLKELKWRPDSRSVLLASLKETGMFKKGSRFFKRA